MVLHRVEGLVVGQRARVVQIAVDPVADALGHVIIWGKALMSNLARPMKAGRGGAEELTGRHVADQLDHDLLVGVGAISIGEVPGGVAQDNVVQPWRPVTPAGSSRSRCRRPGRGR